MKKTTLKSLKSKALSILLLAIMLFSPLTLIVSAENIQALGAESTTSASNKLTDDLKAHLQTISDDEYVPIYIWLNDYGDDMLYTVLSKRLGTTITAQNEEAYISSKISSKTAQFKENLAKMKSDTVSTYALNSSGEIDITTLSASTFRAQGDISEIMTDNEIEACLESGMSAEKIVELSERNQFLHDYRQSRKAISSATNQSFYEQLDLTKCRNVYVDSLLTHVTMECKKSYIYNLLDLARVYEIGSFEDAKFVNLGEVSDNVTIDVLGYPMYKMTPINNFEYDGAGIKIGVAETGSYYDTQTAHLSGKTSESQNEIISYTTGSVSDHATDVIRIIVGDPIPFDGKTYQGVAPKSSLYFAGNTNYLSDLKDNLDWFIENNVSVVNMSFGSSNNYREISKYVDSIVFDYRMVIVCAAGNNYNITNPGSAYNAIAVGNASNIKEESSNKYLLCRYDPKNHYSGYIESAFLSNKPDLIAFGTNLKMLSKNGNTYVVDNLGFGTSNSAPIVTGTIALMMQANPNLIGNPEAVKNLLLLSADEEAIYYNDTEGEEENELISAEPTNINTTKIENVSTILREKSGAGLLNIPAAIRMAQSNTYYSYTFYPTEAINDYGISDIYYFPANTTIEFGLVFEKFTDEILTEKYSHNLNIQLLDSNNNVILQSTDDINNVEIFTCKIKQSGNYRFKIDVIFDPEYQGDNAMHASMSFACGCADKVFQETYTSTQHIISCSCGFTCTENFKIAQVTKTLTNGAQIIYKVSYLPQKAGYSAPSDFLYYNYSYSFATPEGITIHTLMPNQGSYAEITPTGEIRRCNYLAYIEQNGTVNEVAVGGVTIIIDYFDQTVTLTL